MATPQELAAALAAAQKAVDVADLATLQVFQKQVATAQFTVEGFIAAFGALAPTLADSDRQKIVATLFQQFQDTLGRFAEMVNSTARVAGLTIAAE